MVVAARAAAPVELGFRHMREPPEGFALDRLTQVLRQYWELDVRQLAYLAVGFGAHHWEAVTAGGTPYFLALHELGHPGQIPGALEQLEQALGAARWLETEARLEFVVGPVPDGSGAMCRRVAEMFALSVYRWLESEPLPQPDDARTAQLLARLHTVSQSNPTGIVRAEDFLIRHRAEVDDALRHLDTAWTTGPYAEACRQVIRCHLDGLGALMGYYDRGVEQARSSRPAWVISHGEPFGPNLIQTRDGTMHLVDWDSALLAPRERDLWEIPRDGLAWSVYLDLARVRVDEHILRLYRAWYDLAEIAVYVSRFRSPHSGDQNDRQSWDNLLMFLPSRERWPDVVA